VYQGVLWDGFVIKDSIEGDVEVVEFNK